MFTEFGHVNTLTGADTKRPLHDSTPLPGDSEPEPEDSCVERSCFLFSRAGLSRRACLYLTGTWDEPNAIFEALVILAIVVNSVFLAMYNPLAKTESEVALNALIDDAGKAFTLLFTVEMFIKIVSQGFFFFGERTYLRESGWNWLDFVVVVTGYADFIPNQENDLGVFRTVRLMRPLRTISSIKSMRVLVGTLLEPTVLKGIANVCALLCFVFVVFSIILAPDFRGQNHFPPPSSPPP